MKTWIGAAVVTIGVSFGALAFACPAAMGSTAAPASTARVQTGASLTANSPEATDLSARRRYRHHYRYAYRPHYRPYYYPQPYYYARPYYYRPYPYDAPAPFFFGFGFGPW